MREAEVDESLKDMMAEGDEGSGDNDDSDSSDSSESDDSSFGFAEALAQRQRGEFQENPRALLRNPALLHQQLPNQATNELPRLPDFQIRRQIKKKTRDRSP